MTDDTNDVVNHPAHYKDRVPGIECIEVTQHFDFLRGNAIKYLWRAGSKGDTVQDLQKAIWYIQREINNLLAEASDDVAMREPVGCMTQRFRQAAFPQLPHIDRL